MPRELKDNAEFTPVTNFIVLSFPDEGSRIVSTDNPEPGEKRVRSIQELVVIKYGTECKMIRQGDRLIVDVNALSQFKFKGMNYFMTREDNVGCIIR